MFKITAFKGRKEEVCEKHYIISRKYQDVSEITTFPVFALLIISN
jgi:hypothetical protein